ncbi:MAG: hypothetical protein ACPHM2_09255, partial [Alcanivorax sp.]
MHIAAQAVAAFQGQAVIAAGEMDGGGLVGPGIHGTCQRHVKIRTADAVAADTIGPGSATGATQTAVTPGQYGTGLNMQAGILLGEKAHTAIATIAANTARAAIAT